MDESIPKPTPLSGREAHQTAPDTAVESTQQAAVRVRGAWSHLYSALKGLLFCAVVYFLARALADNFGGIRDSLHDLKYRMLLGSTALVTCYLFCQALLWRSILRTFGVRVTPIQAVRLFFVSLFGKYIPGKIWIVAMRVGLSGTTGAPKGTLMASVLIEHVYILSTAVSLYLLTAGKGAAALSGLIILLAVALAPNACLGIADRIARWLGKGRITTWFGAGHSIRYTAAYSATWTLFSLGLWAAAASLAPIGLSDALRLGGMYAVSFAAGFVAPFAPGGLGVREGTFMLLSGPVLSPPVAGVLAILMRLVFTAAELTGLGVSRFLGRGGE